MSLLQTSAVGSDPTRPLAYVLDDEAAVREVVCHVLTSMGFAPSPFLDPAHLYSAIRAAAPHLILLDLSLGKSDAIEVMRRLASLHFSGKILLFSGHGDATLQESCSIGERHGLSMLPPLRKPFRAKQLRKSLAAQATAVPPLTTREDSAPLHERVDLHEALKKGWLELWYQPKIDLKTMSVCGAEALVRLRHPERGVLSAQSFLPPAGSELYQPLTNFVVRRAATHWEHFAAHGHPLKLAINVPVMALQSMKFVEFVYKSLPRRPSFPGLIIEVTEDEAIYDAERLREIAIQLKLHKIELSIDDFGSAYSSLARLRDLSAVELKLDRSYVTGCATDITKKAVCTAAIGLARSFGLTVCAEGVESIDDLRTVIDLGCHTAQGFLFARPMPPAQLIKMLATRTTAAQAQMGGLNAQRWKA